MVFTNPLWAFGPYNADEGPKTISTLSISSFMMELNGPNGKPVAISVEKRLSSNCNILGLNAELNPRILNPLTKAPVLIKSIPFCWAINSLGSPTKLSSCRALITLIVTGACVIFSIFRDPETTTSSNT